MTYGNIYHTLPLSAPVPALLEPPPIFDGYEGWLEDFFELSTNRQLTENGVGPIPLWTARQHCARWDRFTAERFIHCIKKMDAVYRAYQAGVLDIPQVDPDSPEAQNANPARDAVRGILKR